MSKPDVEIVVGSPTGKPDDNSQPGPHGAAPQPAGPVPSIGPVDTRPDHLPSEETYKQILDFGFRGLATVRGDHWQLSEAEVSLYGPATARVLSKHTGGLSDQLSDEALLTLGMGTHILNCVMKDRQKKAKPAKSKPETLNDLSKSRNPEIETLRDLENEEFVNRPEAAQSAVIIGGEKYVLDTE